MDMLNGNWMMDRSFALLPKDYRFRSCYPMTWTDVAMIAAMMAPASVAVAVLLVALLRIGWE
jgi:hypothetical protein